MDGREVTKVGKISDALDKFQNEQNISAQRRNTHKPVSNTAPKIRKAPAMIEAKRADYHDVDKNLIMILNPKSFEAEQIRMLKSQLLFPIAGNRPQSIMVTSALPGEGKSFMAGNLAVSLAQSINDYVLLADCDIRKPTIHRNFGIPDAEGLSDHLSRDIPLTSLLRKTALDKLTILPGGNAVGNPGELLSSQKMSKLLDELKSRYSDRYVIIDSPPPSLTSETNVIARQVDAILLVVKYRSTPRKLLADLTEKLGKEKILGAVMNMCDFKSPLQSYNKYGKYTNYYNSYYNE